MERGDFAGAARTYEEVLELAQRHGVPADSARMWLAGALTLLGDAARARVVCVEALTGVRALGSWELAGRALDVAALLAAESEPGRALRIAAAVSRHRESTGRYERVPFRSRLERAIEHARQTLGPSADAAWAEGWALTVEQALDLALTGGGGSGSQSAVRENLAASPLTRREREVAALVARGLTDRQVAKALVIAEGTAGIHVQHILAKLGFRSRSQIAAWTVEHRLTAQTAT